MADERPDPLPSRVATATCGAPTPAGLLGHGVELPNDDEGAAAVGMHDDGL